ncbi:MAG: NusG domain II-containing protein, partial [Lachnospiraceae bacterium]|nr:NusG domain II-containing protein [Lachnospiraceae bacterium]
MKFQWVKNLWSGRDKRNDLILFLVLIGAALVLSLVLYGKENGGGIVVVQVDGKKTASYPLDQDRDVMIRVPGGGYNHLMIRNGECY